MAQINDRADTMTNPRPIGVPYPVYKWPNYKVAGRAFRQSQDGTGFSNFAVSHQEADTINRIHLPQDQIHQSQQPYNSVTTQEYNRHSKHYFRENYNDYKLYEEAKLPDDHVHNEMMRNVQEASQITNLFFMEGNVKKIKHLLADGILKQSKGMYPISAESQSTDYILHTMVETYNSIPVNHLPHIERPGVDIRKHIDSEVHKLNNAVLDVLIPFALVKVQQYLGYVRDHSQPHKTIDHPINVNVKGTKIHRDVSCLFP